MKRYLVIACVLCLSAGVFAMLWQQTDVDDSASSTSFDASVSVPTVENAQGQSNETPSSTMASPNQDHSAPIDTASLSLVAPQSDTLDALDADLSAFADANTDVPNGNDLPINDVLTTPTFVDVDLTLWRASESAKSVFENYRDVQSMDEKHFIEFDDTSLDTLAPGQRLSLPAIGDERIQVIVKSEEAWNQGAINWVLVDDHGRPAGSITQMQDSVR